jgi:hypothetical protein
MVLARRADMDGAVRPMVRASRQGQESIRATADSTGRTTDTAGRARAARPRQYLAPIQSANRCAAMAGIRRGAQGFAARPSPTDRHQRAGQPDAAFQMSFDKELKQRLALLTSEA